MKIIQKTTLLLLAILFAAVAIGQSKRRATKEYELYAYNLAINSYTKYLKRKSSDLEAMGNLADCYRMTNQMEQAEKWYAKVVSKEHVEPYHFLNYGKVLKALGKYDEAKKMFNKFGLVNAEIGGHFASSCDFAKEQVGTSVYDIINEAVNSTAADYATALYEGAQVCFASSDQVVRKKGGYFETNHLFVAQGGGTDKKLYNKSLMTLAKGKKGITNKNIGPLAFYDNGKKVAYTKNNFVDGTRQIPGSGMELSLYFADVNADGTWKNERAFQYNSSAFSTGYPSLSPDGRVLYFASDRPDGFGGFDIYYSLWNGETWSPPYNLGGKINSFGNEVSPFFDGKSLYFSSDTHFGFGGYDVFRAEQNENDWSDVFNLGAGINSSYDDLYYVFDSEGGFGYFTSNRKGGKGAEDIYRFARTKGKLAVKVVNASDEMPIFNAKIDLDGCGLGDVTTDINGVAQFDFDGSSTCDMLVRKDGYHTFSFDLSKVKAGVSKMILISMAKISEQYDGKVIDARSGTPLKGVKVKFSSILKDARESVPVKGETITDDNGNYSFAFKPNTSYVLLFSRPGFREVNRTVSTFDGTDRAILGTISLPPTGELASTEPATSLDLSSTEVETEETETPESTTSAPAYTETITTYQDGFVVQLAAVPLNKEVNLESFVDRLGSYGTVYFTTIDKYNKVRLGYFLNKAAAMAALRTAKSKGYKQAFLVHEQVPVTEEHTVPATGVSSSTYVAPAAASDYGVQLASYKNPKWFEEDKVTDIGILKRYKKGVFTVMVLTGYDSLDEASSALATARNRGFKDAILVKKENGVFVKLD